MFICYLCFMPCGLTQDQCIPYLDYALTLLMQCINPCEMFWGGEYTIWLNHMLKGFNPCMAMETNIISKLPNYGKVVFGLGGGNQLVPLMHIGFRGNRNLGLAHDGFFISLVIWGLVLALNRRENGGDLYTQKVSFTLDFMPTFLFSFEASIIGILLTRGFAGWLQMSIYEEEQPSSGSVVCLTMSKMQGKPCQEAYICCLSACLCCVSSFGFGVLCAV